MKKFFYVGFFILILSLFFGNLVLAAETNLSSGVSISGKITSTETHTYQFTASDDGEVYITLDEMTGGFSLYLYNANGDRLGGDYYSTSGNKIVINQNLQKGTYYLKVMPYGWNIITSAAYRIKATYPSPFTRNSSTLEPNDTNETAVSLISNKLYSSKNDSSIDRDVYQFTTNKNDKATIVLDNTTGGTSIYLYDRDGRRLLGDYWSSGGNTIKLEATLAKGTYYIKVNPYGWNGITSAGYRLKATFADKTPSVDPIYDTGTTLSGTAVSNTKVYAVIGSSKIGETTAKDGKFSIKIPKQKSGTKIGVYTIDSAGNRSATKTITVVSAAVNVASAGPNKLKVSWMQLAGVQGYELYRSTSKTGTYNKVATVTSGSTLSYTNSSLIKGKTYYYKVRAYRTSNGKKVFSPFSNIGSGKSN